MKTDYSWSCWCVVKMSHAENVAALQAALAPNSRSASNLFLNHDEHILRIISCDGSNPAVHFTLFWVIKFIFKLIRTCCCWLFFWNRGTEKIKNVLVLTNQRLIKFKESTGSQNGDFPKRFFTISFCGSANRSAFCANVTFCATQAYFACLLNVAV
jgi:hypothetical protein